MALRNLLSSLFLLGTLGACAVDDTMCPAVSGVYEPTYTPLDGTCGFITSPNMLPFGESSGSGSIKTLENRLNDDVTTEVVHKGCTVRVSQTVATKEGILQSQIEGESIKVHNARELSGRVQYIRFNAFNQIECQGNYEATIRKPTPLGIP